MSTVRRALAGALATALVLLAVGGHADEANDLRDLRVGMSVGEIPAGEYIDLTCAAAPGLKLGQWSEFPRCPAAASGEREVGFRYDDRLNPLARVNDTYEGTKIAGHPVVLALLIDTSGRVAALRIDTDPHARLFWRKKAYLLAPLVKIRYGEAGWACRDVPPAGGEAPVGGVLIKQHCEKSGEHRRILLDQLLYRSAGQSLSEFVNATHVLIRSAPD